MTVGFELIDEPHRARVAEPEALREQVDRVPGREAGERGDRRRAAAGPEAETDIADSRSRASTSTTAPSTFAV